MADPDEISAVVSRVGERAIRRGHVGLVVGVAAGGEEVVCGFGRARDDSDTAPDGRTIFELGSITKVFTAALLCELASEGIVALDDPLEAHLPGGVRGPRTERPLTLAQLASHTAGLPREPTGTLRTLLRHPLHPYRALLDLYASRSIDDVYASLARSRVRSRRPRYSNLGAGVLGNVLAARLGRSYGDAVRERICLPLGLPDTAVEPAGLAGRRLAHGHARRGGRRPPFANPALPGAGSLRSTAADMLRFLCANLDPPEGALGAALELAQKPRARSHGSEFALGWLIAPAGRRVRHRLHWHNGGTGGFRSFAGFARDAGVAVVVLSNTNRSVDLLALRLLRSLGEKRSRCGPGLHRPRVSLAPWSWRRGS